MPFSDQRHLLYCCAAAPFNASSRGFCRHQVPGFGPWHRAYLRQFELALLDSARAAAAQFRDDNLRSQYEAEAEKLRLCYWDWVSKALLRICNVGNTAYSNLATSQATSTRSGCITRAFCNTAYTCTCEPWSTCVLGGVLH